MTPDLTGDLAGPCTCFALRRAARHVTQAYDKSLAPSGLRTTQFSLLNRLARAGPRSIQLLARDMGLDRTTLGRNLRPLEREGLVTIAIDPQDRRGRALQITAEGKIRLHEAQHLWAAAQTRFVEVYGADRAKALHATLDGLTEVDLGA